MGSLSECELHGRFYCCKFCYTHLAYLDDVVSKKFKTRTGMAYIFSSVVNVKIGTREDTIMSTGLHTVANISCKKCENVLGWKYEKAYKKSQRYKEGKFLLERDKIIHWDEINVEFFDDPANPQITVSYTYQSDDSSVEG